MTAPAQTMADSLSVDAALLPCPFCGADGEIEETAASQASGSLVVYRGNCSSVGHASLTWTPDRSEAVAGWNIRYDDHPAKRIRAITAKMRRTLPSTCGDWAAEIDTALAALVQS